MTWTFHNPVASVRAGIFAGRVDVAQPHLGLHSLQLNSQPLNGRMCAVERDASEVSSNAPWPAKVIEAYVRGDDLVATYRESDDWPFAPQVYWRVDTKPPIQAVLGTVSLQVSVSTHLLDTHPRISAVTQIPCDEALHIVPSNGGNSRATLLTTRSETRLHAEGAVGCLLWRLPGAQFSYVEIVSASDFRVLTINRDKDSTFRARWELISEFLEKGVIRRTCLEAVFLPRDRDVELAAQCCRNVANRPLPLTT